VARSATKVVTLGEILVEIVAQERGDGFREPLPLVGPFPSGAPAIFIDQVARLGQPCGIISCVGEDDFGWVNLDRLSRDGVDVGAIEVLPGHATGSAFVRYRESGERDFVFNIKNSACGQIRLTEAARSLLEECGHLHVSGASLFSERAIDVASEAVLLVKQHGGSVSFDPNVRKEVMGDPKMLAALEMILSRSDIFLPSGDELTLLTEATTPAEAVAEILALGVREIVVKQGTNGATYYGPDGQVDWPAYPVREVDPTGAGDCFDAAFITCRLQGRSVEESLDYANAAGARTVTVRGPMEGTSTFAQLDALRSAGHSTVAPPRIAGWLLRGASGATEAAGITSVCSAHPLVLEAAMLEAASRGRPALIEATCNQVNHAGGYTGLTPTDFRDLVLEVADRVAFPRGEIMLGGDHLGPSPWRHLAAAEAMEQAEAMVEAYVSAGFEKIHLDTSMGCLGEPESVPAELAGTRAARLAVVAEQATAAAGKSLRYVVGTEVPTPGGATEEIERLEVTRPEAAIATLEEHVRAFTAAGVPTSAERIVAVVVQPGVEFDDRKVVTYRPELAAELSAALDGMPGLVFEAHSTDYQPPEKLAQLVRDGFAILKVGPALTFALRRALYALDRIATALDASWSDRSLAAGMERVMLADPGYWRSHYHGGPEQERWLRHFAYSDRIRYYWSAPASEGVVAELFSRLGDRSIPESLVAEFLPDLHGRVVGGLVPAEARALVLEAVRDVLRGYAAACDVAPVTGQTGS
jgi:D-tagatose-bisphosphate aldolase class II non-catalytic subunit